MLNLPVHGPTRPGSAPSSGTWTPRTARPATVTTYLLSHRRTTGRRLPARPRHQPEGGHLADLEAFLADLLARQTASTAGAYHKILYGWLAEEKEIPTNPIMPADSSPARANILVPPGGLEPPVSGFARRRSVPELQGQGAGAGGEGGGEPAPSTLPASRLPAELRPRVAGVIERSGFEPAQPVATVLQTAPWPMRCLCMGAS